MSRRTELLGGGLVTVMDPMLLKPGQLSAMQNATYYPSDPALHRSKGRALFGAASAQAVDVVGLRNAQFDSGDHILVAHASGSFFTAAVADTGTFGTLSSTVGIGTQLEVVHYRNRFFLMNGSSLAASATAVNSNWIIYQSATAAGTTPTLRQHGMRPVTSPPTCITAATAFSQSVTGYYDYWTTEVALYTQDGAELPVESTFQSNTGPTTMFVSTTASAVMIQRPGIFNSTATHWRVYRSPRKGSAAEKQFPTGFLISSEISIAATSMVDTASVTSTGIKVPASFNGVADGATMFVDMGAQATAVASGDTIFGTMAGSLTLDKGQGVYGFNFGGFTGPVQGIEVKITAKVSAGTVPLSVTLVRKRQADGGIIPHFSDFGPAQESQGKLYRKQNTVSKSFSATTVSTLYTLGGPTDRWLSSDMPSPLRDSDFGSSFMVIINNAYTAVTVSVDLVTVNIYYGGSIDSVSVFPTVVYSFGDIAAQVGKNGPPPSSSTGDLYEDSLVVNDVDAPSTIRWSYPGDTDAFPSTYFIDFETRDNDRVTLVKTVGSHLIVALRTSVWRVNYLPSERDASFDRGKAIDPISKSHGVINPMCACTFTRDGGHEEVAFVSYKGIHSTDAFSFTTRSGNLDWRSHFPTTATAIALVNDAENERLMFFFRNDANGNESYLRLDLSYAKGDVDGLGVFKTSGPTHMRNYHAASGGRADLKSAWAVPRSSGDTSVYFGYGGTSTAAGAGTVYLETGTTIPAQDSTMRFTTRRMYLGGLGAEWRCNYLLGYSGSYSSTPTAAYTLLTTKTNDTGETTGSSKTLTLAGQRIHRVELAGIAEGARISAIVTGTDYQQELLVIEGDNFGEADSGRS